jgi:hypothetical protein
MAAPSGAAFFAVDISAFRSIAGGRERNAEHKENDGVRRELEGESLKNLCVLCGTQRPAFLSIAFRFMALREDVNGTQRIKGELLGQKKNQQPHRAIADLQTEWPKGLFFV